MKISKSLGNVVDPHMLIDGRKTKITCWGSSGTSSRIGGGNQTRLHNLNQNKDVILGKRIIVENVIRTVNFRLN